MDDSSLPGDQGEANGRRKTWFGLLLALALLAAGAGAWMLGQPPKKAAARLSTANQPINAGAREGRDISANNSPVVARNPVDPVNLVVANRIDRPNFSCALHASFNGGASWERMTVPFPAGEEEPPRCFAPDVAYAADGTLHMSFVTLKGVGNVPSALWVVSSKDGGRTLSVPVRAAGQLTFQSQLTTDTSQANRLYLTWLQAEATGSLLFPGTGYPIVTSTSIDGGATWSAPVPTSSPGRQRVVAPSPALGPNGELYVLYLDLLEDRLDYAGAHEGRGGDPYEGPWALVLARSTDQGTTWEETLVDGGIRPTERFIVFLPPSPALAVDPVSGRIYAGFTDGRAGDADVNVWTSSDGGRTFSPPVRVNDTSVGDGTAQYLPRMDVAPGGRLDVVYFDRRADATNIFNEVSLQSSFDGGRTFTRRVRVSDKAFDSRIGPGSERGLPDLGTRLALVSTARRALAVWPDTRGGTELTGKQDLASAVVDIPPPAPASRGWLRIVGAVGILLGLVSLVMALRTRRRAGGVVLYDPSVARPAPPRAARPQPAPPVTPAAQPTPPPAPAGPAPAPPEHPAPVATGAGEPHAAQPPSWAGAPPAPSEPYGSGPQPPAPVGPPLAPSERYGGVPLPQAPAGPPLAPSEPDGGGPQPPVPVGPPLAPSEPYGNVPQPGASPRPPPGPPEPHPVPSGQGPSTPPPAGPQPPPWASAAPPLAAPGGQPAGPGQPPTGPQPSSAPQPPPRGEAAPPPPAVAMPGGAEPPWSGASPSVAPASAPGGAEPPRPAPPPSQSPPPWEPVTAPPVDHGDPIPAPAPPSPGPAPDPWLPSPPPPAPPVADQPGGSPAGTPWASSPAPSPSPTPPAEGSSAGYPEAEPAPPPGAGNGNAQPSESGHHRES